MEFFVLVFDNTPHRFSDVVRKFHLSIAVTFAHLRKMCIFWGLSTIDCREFQPDLALRASQNVWCSSILLCFGECKCKHKHEQWHFIIWHWQVPSFSEGTDVCWILLFCHCCTIEIFSVSWANCDLAVCPKFFTWTFSFAKFRKPRKPAFSLKTINQFHDKDITNGHSHLQHEKLTETMPCHNACFWQHCPGKIELKLSKWSKHGIFDQCQMQNLRKMQQTNSSQVSFIFHTTVMNPLCSGGLCALLVVVMVGDTPNTAVVPLVSALLQIPPFLPVALHEREGFFSQLCWLIVVTMVGGTPSLTRFSPSSPFLTCSLFHCPLCASESFPRIMSVRGFSHSSSGSVVVPFKNGWQHHGWSTVKFLSVSSGDPKACQRDLCRILPT